MSAQLALPMRTPATNVGTAAHGNNERVESFFNNLGVIAEAEGGVAHLRQLSLRLAFQGRFTSKAPLVPAVVRGRHEALSVSKGRDATSTIVPGDAALAVGPAEMMIPDGWEWLPLVAVARLESGHTPSRNHQDYWDGGIPWIGIRDAKAYNFRWIDSTEQTVSKKGLENSSARLLPAGTVCLSRTASVGYVTIMQRPMATSQDFVNWVCGDRLDPEYLMHLLRCEVPVLRRFSKGAVHQTIYFPEVKAFHISLPPLAEQKRIVAKVDQLMALCDELEARQTKKRETGNRLTKSALEALTTAETPEDFDRAWTQVSENFDLLVSRPDSVRELRKRVLALAVSGRFHAHNLDAVRVGDYVTFLNGYAFKSEWFTDSGVALLRNVNIGHGRVKWQDVAFVSDAQAATLGRFSLTAGDVVVSLDRPLIATGVKVAKIAPEDLPCLLLQRVAKVVIRDESTVSLDFFFWWLQSPYFTEAIDPGRSNGVPHIFTKSIEELRFWVPPIRAQQKIVAFIESFMALCDKLEASLARREEAAAKLAEALAHRLSE